MCTTTISDCVLTAVLGGMVAVAEAAAKGGVNFKLKEGFSAETSGMTFTLSHNE